MTQNFIKENNPEIMVDNEYGTVMLFNIKRISVFPYRESFPIPL